MIDIFNFGTVAGGLELDARTAGTFKGVLSGNLSIALNNTVEGASTLLYVDPNSFTPSFTSVTFPTGTTFSTSAVSVVRVTRVNSLLYGELLNP